MAHDCGLDDSTLAGGFPGDEDIRTGPAGLHLRQYNAGPQIIVFDGNTPLRPALKSDMGLRIGPDVDTGELHRIVALFNAKSDAAYEPATVPDPLLDEIGRELAGLESARTEPPPEDPAPTNQLLRQFAQLQLKRRELEEALEVVNKGIASLEPEILEYFADQGIQSANVLGLCCYMKTDFFVSKKADKDGVTTQVVCDAMRDFGLEYMVSDGYSAASLKSKIKEWLKEGVEVPERLRSLLNIGEQVKIATRKS